MQIKVKQKSIHNSICNFFNNGISVGSSQWQCEPKVDNQQNGVEVR